MEVICDSCRQIYHETSDSFDGSKPSNGTAFRLKEYYRDASWSSFVETPDSEYGTLECPGCNVPYGAGSGFVTTKDSKGNIIEAAEYQEAYNKMLQLIADKEQNNSEEFKCPTCQKICMSNAGLSAHMRGHK